MNNKIKHNAEIFFIDGTTKSINFVRQSDNDHGLNLHPNEDLDVIIFIPYSSMKCVILTQFNEERGVE